MFNYHITTISNNKKTGPIPVTTTSKNSCPDTCGMRKVCYADFGPLRLHWDKVTDGTRGISLIPFTKKIRALPRGQLWRHNQAGDLPHDYGQIRYTELKELVSANHGKRGFTYTHHARTIENIALIRAATQLGFTINISCDTVSEAISEYNLGYHAVTTILPIDAPNVDRTHGVPIVACPAEKTDRVTCSTCAMCYKPDRKYIIGFRAHGTRKHQADIIARG